MMSLSKEDRACRMSGDEFAEALFFDKDTPDAQMQERAQQIFDKVNITLKSVEGGAGISMGMVIADSDVTFNQLYEAADKALYHAKDHGRGRLAAL